MMTYGKEWNTPVLILNCRIGALSIMRSLGSLGVPVYGVDDDPKSPALLSKYLKKFFIKSFQEKNSQEYLDYIIDLAKNTIKTKAILIPTSDELSIFVAEYRDQLREHFYFSDMPKTLVEGLADKRKMFELAIEHGVPAPHTSFPVTLSDVRQTAKEVVFPVVLKAIDGNKLYSRCEKKMVICEDREELIHQFTLLDDPSDPNLMIQELIPGDDDQVFIYNGCFNSQSDPLISFTGHKVRQFPVHVGCASLGECSWNQTVADITCQLMKDVHYQGILDIGYRLDPRDGQYKVLDINPRVGQAFRLFLANNGMDVVRSLYLDLTGQSQPESSPREGRRWFIEDYDLVSSHGYYKEHSLDFFDWIKSYKGVEESAWFNIHDLKPFLSIARRFGKKFFTYIGKLIRHTQVATPTIKASH